MIDDDSDAAQYNNDDEDEEQQPAMPPNLFMPWLGAQGAPAPQAQGPTGDNTSSSVASLPQNRTSNDAPQGAGNTPQGAAQTPDTKINIPQRGISNVEPLISQMPQLPHPSIWRRLGAAALGGVAGYMNTSAGYPGHMKQPINPTAAENNILGYNDYNRQMSSWGNRVKMAEYMDTQQEQQRQHDLQAAEVQARLNMSKATMQQSADYHRMMAEASQERAAAQEEGRRQQWGQNHLVTMPQWTDLNPTTQQTASATNMPTLPGTPAPMNDTPEMAPTMPQMPAYQRSRLGGVNASITPEAQTSGGYTPVNMPGWAQQEYGQGAQAYAVSPIEKNAQIEQNKLVDVPEELQPYLGQKAMPTMVNAFSRLLKTQNARTSNPNGTLLQMRAAGAQTGDERIDAMSPAQAKSALMATPAGANITLNAPPAFSANQRDFASMEPGPERERQVLATLSPEDQIRTKQVLDGDVPMNGYMLSRSPEYKRASLFASLANPDWNASNYDTIRKMNLDYTPGGAVGKNLVSLNTLSQHMDEFFQAMKALNNGDTTALNWFHNNLGMQFGQEAYSNANLANTAVTAELATALKGNATDTEIGQWVKNLKPNMSPQQQDGAKRALAEIMYKRMDNQLYPYVSTRHKLPMTGPTPATQQFLRSAGLDPSNLGTGLGANAGPQTPSWLTSAPPINKNGKKLDPQMSLQMGHPVYH
jgi:hypothetical protein